MYPLVTQQVFGTHPETSKTLNSMHGTLRQYLSAGDHTETILENP